MSAIPVFNLSSFFLLLKQEHVHIIHTYGTERDKLVLPWVDVLVIGTVPPHVSGAVDQPGGVQHQGVPQQGRDEVGHPQGLPPQVPRHRRGDEEAHEQHRRLVIPVEGIEWADSRRNEAVYTVQHRS